jgi:hypothetical protein
LIGIELELNIPSTHQTKYKLNLNYATLIKQDSDKLVVVGFIQFVKEAVWLSPIVVVKKDMYALPFTNEVLNIITKYEAYSFLDGYS